MTTDRQHDLGAPKAEAFTRNWVCGAGLHRSLRRRLMAVLRQAHRALGMGRKRLGLGALGVGGAVSVALVALMMEASPAHAANLAIRGATENSTNGAGVSYAFGSHGSIVLAGDDDYCGADAVVGRGGVVGGITAEQEYERFATNQAFGAYNPYGTSTAQVTWTGDGYTTGNVGYMGALTGGRTNAQPRAFGTYSFATGCGSWATGNYSTAFGANATATEGGAMAFGVAALASGRASIAFGIGSEAADISSIALGSLATSTAAEAIAIGLRSRATNLQSIAIGSGAEANGLQSISIGTGNIVNGNNSGAIGDPNVINGAGSYALGNDNTIDADNAGAFGNNNILAATATGSRVVGNDNNLDAADAFILGNGADVTVDGGVAIGSGSIAAIGAGVAGYDPVTDAASTDTSATWLSTASAVSVGDAAGGVTRQITGVAAGTADTDAVNVAQLRQVRTMAGTGWDISAEGLNVTNVGVDSATGNAVDLNNADGNIVVSKTAAANDVTFDLASDLTVGNSVTVGASLLDTSGLTVDDGTDTTSLTATGLTITGGPSVTVAGVDAGGLAITNVGPGVNGT
ncbi:hypothetical protein ACFFJ2_05700, partial [Chelativorans intermedius]